ESVAVRQRPRVHQPAFPGLVRRTRYRGDSYSAWKADAERARGELQRTIPGRMPECELVREPGGCQTEDRKLARGVQRGATSQQPGVSHAGGMRKNLLSAHQQDGRPPAEPPVDMSGSHAGARGQGFATPRKTRAPLPAVRRRAEKVRATGGSGGMARWTSTITTAFPNYDL